MSAPARLTATLRAVGTLGPGLPDWPAAARALAGDAYSPQPTRIPAQLECLPGAERRRTGAVVRLAVTAGLEAIASSAASAVALPAVFSSSGGDGLNCHEICEVLASAERQISPTRFHNSVHNAAAGYWGIATGATAPANALCAHDASFGAGLIEALTQAAVEATAVLLVAYDADYPEPMRRVRPIPDAFAVAMLLEPQARPGAVARLTLSVTDAPATRMDDARLEALRAGIPAARCLPLLRQLALEVPGAIVIDYLEDQRLSIEVGRCP
jgi:Beta-ketoacyl synthase, N-terminal domain